MERRRTKSRSSRDNLARSQKKPHAAPNPDFVQALGSALRKRMDGTSQSRLRINFNLLTLSNGYTSTREASLLRQKVSTTRERSGRFIRIT